MKPQPEEGKASVTPYDHGYDCGINGPNQTNCNFSIFSSPENTKEWERGKKDAEIKKLNHV